MEKFLEIRHVAESAREAGLDKAERRRLVEEGDDYVNEIIMKSHPEKISSDEDEKYYSGEKVHNSDKFFDFMEGSDEGRHVALGLGAVFRKYGSKERKASRETLMADEGRLVSVAIKYFEDWFYKGTFLKKFEKEPDRENYHAISAFIVNQLAKIKEVRENNELVKGFDTQKLEQLIGDVEAFAEEYLTEENLKKRFEERADAIKAMEDELQPLQTKAEPFNQKINKAEDGFKSDYAKICELLKQADSNPNFSNEEKESLQRLGDILEEFDEFSYSMHQTEVQHILLSNGGTLMDALKKRISYTIKHGYYETEAERDKNETRSQNALREVGRIEVLLQKKFKSSENSQEHKTKVKPQKVSGFAALGGLKEGIGEKETIKLLEGLVGESWNKARNSLNEQYRLKDEVVDGWEISRKKGAVRELELELQRARDLYVDRKKIRQALGESVASVRESLKSPAGDLYLLKTIIIAAAEQAAYNKGKKFPDFYPDKNISKTSRQDMVFNFGSSYRLSGNEGNGDYTKVHFEPFHIPFAQFVVEMMKDKVR